jgi:uncharacterized protein (TIGR02757 family)
MKSRSTGLTPSRANAVAPLLERFLAEAPQRERLANDPVELPHRYRDPRDIEVAGLLSACLAYGRVELFKPKLEALLGQMGTSPANFVAALDAVAARELLQGFVYRFNVAADLGVLLLGMGRALRERGSLEAVFVEQFEHTGALKSALDGFTATLRDVPMREVRAALGRERGLDHLLPSPLGPGAAKRLNLFLRWMVRGPDEIDFGIWKRVSPAVLIIPLDTHIARISRRIGLTRRKDLGWKTAEEITASLRRIDPADPVKFDFALCHHGMSGQCAIRPVPAHCSVCALRAGCPIGARAARRC